MKLLLIVLSLATLVLPVTAQDAAAVRRDGRGLSFSSEGQPFFFRGVAMVPVRETSRLLGVGLTTERSGMRLLFTRGRNRVIYDQGRREFEFNDERRSLREPSQTRDTVLFVPLELFQLLVGGLSAEPSRELPAQERQEGQEPSIFFRRDRLTYERDERPYRRRSVVYVPLRATAARTRVEVERNDNGDVLTLRYEGRQATYRKGTRYLSIGEARQNIEAPAEEVREVLYVPAGLFQSLVGPEFGVNAPGSTRPSTTRPGPVVDSGVPADFEQLKAGEWGVFVRGRLSGRLREADLPYESRGVLMVPLRAVGEAIGGWIQRAGDDGTTRLTRGRDVAEYTMGEKGFRHNGRYLPLPQPGESKNGVVYVPVGFFGRFDVAIMRG